MNNEKIFIHFDTNITHVYTLSDELKHIETYNIFFNETYINDELYKKLDFIINDIKDKGFEVNNKTTRLFATGIFEELSPEEKQQLIIHSYTRFGLYMNVLEKDLKEFYLSNSENNNIIEGLVKQEFRTVVVCGSFQKYMNEINEIRDLMKKHNIEVLSPWTSNLVEESLGTDFILLEGQELENERDAWRHKLDHMNKFKKADAIIVCDPNGTVGKGTMFEFGFMIAHTKRIIFVEEPTNLSILFPYEIGLNFK